MILVDTSVLVNALTAARPLAESLARLLDSGDRIALATPVLYEWLRGPRTPDELAAQRAIFPDERAVVFGVAEARLAANLYQTLPRPRGREADIAIAACALTREAQLWTVNQRDFADIPNLRHYSPDGVA